MDTTMHTFLEILKAALLGQKAEPGEIMPREWEKLFNMAGIHKVLPRFYEAVYASPSLHQAELPFLPAIKRQVRQQVMMQTMRTGEFLQLNQALQAAGIKPLVVKGIICRNLYPQPDHRQSSDEDVLIPEGEFAACHQVMTDFGMQTTVEEAEMAAAYEIPYRKAGSPLYIELHKHLFPPEKVKHAVLTSAFPPASKLEGRYPYLKKHPCLLPVAWCSRLWTYSKETKNTQNNNAAEALKIGSERIELMKEYGILK